MVWLPVQDYNNVLISMEVEKRKRKIQEYKSSDHVPERATRSTKLSPCLLNLVRMVWKVLFGAGISLFEPLRLAPLESLLPSGTSQWGPPACISKQKSHSAC